MNLLDYLLMGILGILILLAIRSIIIGRGCNDCHHCHKKENCKNGQTSNNN